MMSECLIWELYQETIRKTCVLRIVSLSISNVTTARTPCPATIFSLTQGANQTTHWYSYAKSSESNMIVKGPSFVSEIFI